MRCGGQEAAQRSSLDAAYAARRRPSEVSVHTEAHKPDIDRFEQELLAEIQSAYGEQGAAGIALVASTFFMSSMLRQSTKSRWTSAANTSRPGTKLALFLAAPSVLRGADADMINLSSTKLRFSMTIIQIKKLCQGMVPHGVISVICRLAS